MTAGSSGAALGADFLGEAFWDVSVAVAFFAVTFGEALAEAAREDPSVLAEATAEAITRMYSMEEILKMNRSRWNRCRKRWEN